MCDKENRSAEIMEKLIDETDIEFLKLDEKTLEKLKKLPERMEEESWDRI